MVNSRAKGAVGERELSKLFRDRGYGDAKRGQQRSGLEEADIVGGPDRFHWECKRVEKLNVWQAFAQAVRDADGKTPTVAMRRNKGEWLAVLRLHDLLDLLDEIDLVR